jgi:hypothetical protein
MSPHIYLGFRYRYVLIGRSPRLGEKGIESEDGFIDIDDSDLIQSLLLK